MLCKNPFLRNPVGYRTQWEMVNSDKEDLLPLPCGKCLHCRINRQRIWTTRLMLEGMDYDEKIFVTLTYDDEFLPYNQELCPEDFTKFVKRLRRRLQERKIRYYMVGEYGDKNSRPHYHAIIFGISENDREVIEKAWSFKEVPIGIVHIGEFNKSTVKYVCGYVLKGFYQENEYVRKKLNGRRPEFSRMSRVPGIGVKRLYKIMDKMAENGVGPKDQIFIGGKAYPLGRTLRNLMFDNLGSVNEMEDRKTDFLWEVLNENLKFDGLFVDNVLESSKQKRRNQESSTKIYKQRRRL